MATKVAPTQKLKGLLQHPSTRQWFTKIGYHETKDGKRVRSYQYHGVDQDAAIPKAVATQIEWNQIVANTKEEDKEYRRLFPHMPPKLPVWPSKKATSDSPAPQAKAEIEQAPQPTPQTPSQIEVTGLTPKTSDISITDAKERYLQSRKDRLELKKQRAIKKNSYKNDATFLNLALKPIPADKIRAKNPEKSAQELERLIALKPIDPTRKLSGLSRAELQSFINYWWAEWNGLSPRTAKNYSMALYHLLRWAAQQDDLNFTMPKGAEDLFRFSNVNRINIQKYDPEQFKRIKKYAPEKCWLYCLLATNAGGMYQSDVGHLRFDEIVKLVNGEPVALTYDELKAYDGSYDVYVHRLRDRTEHKVQSKAIHLLWPETVKLLAKHLAPSDNPYGYVLLNRDGKPLYNAKEDGKDDAISSTFKRTCDKAKEKGEEITLTFKQFRKIGATAMASISGDMAVRQYRSQPPEGDAKLYVADDYQKWLTPALKTWREKLIADGVI